MKDERLKPKRNMISFPCETRLCFGVIHIHPRVFLKRDSFSPLILDVLLCKSLFYRKIFSNLDKNIPMGYQESPPKVCSDIYVRVLIMTLLMSSWIFGSSFDPTLTAFSLDICNIWTWSTALD